MNYFRITVKDVMGSGKDDVYVYEAGDKTTKGQARAAADAYYTSHNMGGHEIEAVRLPDFYVLTIRTGSGIVTQTAHPDSLIATLAIDAARSAGYDADQKAERQLFYDNAPLDGAQQLGVYDLNDRTTLYLSLTR